MARYGQSDKRSDLRREMRADMLRAAEELIRESGSVSFSVGELAKRAECSVASLYNIIGTKPKILYALLNKTMDKISIPSHFNLINISAVDSAIRTAEHAAGIFIDDPGLMRPLYAYVLGVSDPVQLSAFQARSLAYWMKGLAAVFESNIIPKEISFESFARDHMVFFAGAVYQWVHEELDDVKFMDQVRLGAILRLLVTDDILIRRDLIRRLSGRLT